MFYIADLHIHSLYSRATSKALNLESLYQWARIKGIHVVGTGDFTHPFWFKELKEKLVPDGSGFYKLKDPPKDPAIPGIKCQDIDVRFCLTTEISSIYKHGDKVRKNHNLLFAPDLDTVLRINAKLAAIGNVESDGRPILGLPSRDLLEIVLETSDQANLIPAHLWTPWFSLLGSKSGYDSVNECFRDLSGHIFALETGLSSDPEMNWRLSALDKYTLVSNSDAHSAQKLGREANLFDTDISYQGMFNALKTRKGFLGTYEFFPEEGKYHLDGHRKCNVCFDPEETIKHKEICPSCGKKLTVGVLHRVMTLADRKKSQKPEDAAGFHYIIPLPEIISEIKRVGPNSKAVQKIYQHTISAFGNEFTLLREASIEDISRKCGTVLSEAIKRMRLQQVNPIAGYDGEFGVIHIFNKGEIESLSGQLFFFEEDAVKKMDKRESKHNLPDTGKSGSRMELPHPTSKDAKTEEPGIPYLNQAQLAVQQSMKGATLVTAGPGTGKTQTLIHWITNCINEGHTKPEEILAVTFTNKAADEMQERLTTLLGNMAKGIQVSTFHSVCYSILQERYPDIKTVYDAENRQVILRFLFPGSKEREIKKLARELSSYFELGESAIHEVKNDTVKAYRQYLEQQGAVDLNDIIGQVVTLWQNEPEWLEKYRQRYKAIAVDEFQDINSLQYRFLSLLGRDKNLLVIGDPDQAIYGFRGSDVKLFFQFKEDFNAREINLIQNYRSDKIILEAAGNIIQNNELKSDLKLVGKKSGGKKIKLFNATDTMSEARYLVDEIEKHVGGTSHLVMETLSDINEGNYAFSDIAILFRLRSVGKELLSHLKKSGIPAHFGDGSSFLAEPPFCVIADILRLYLNPKDMISLDGVLTHCLGWDRKKVTLLLSALHETQGELLKVTPTFLSTNAQQSLTGWQSFFQSLPETFQKNGVVGAVNEILEHYLPDTKLDESQLLKKESILSLAYESQAEMEHFLKKITLNPYTDVGRLKTEGVHLLTFHAAKGLEFPIVLIAGSEEGITPLLRQDADIEEERRLFYVALTRAKDEVQITYAANRREYGQLKAMEPSRFIGEIPDNLIERVELKKKRKQVKQTKSSFRFFKPDFLNLLLRVYLPHPHKIHETLCALNYI
ncbi:MAG: UvrD-helicase domain-containing protein [Bacteroidota bacterium]